MSTDATTLTAVARFEDFIVRTNGLDVLGAPSYLEWRGLVRQLGRLEGAIQWAIGDALNFGEREYGEMYADAVDETQAGTWMNYAWVASKIESSTRVEHLSWSHHRLVAKLPPEVQRRLLSLAAPLSNASASR